MSNPLLASKVSIPPNASSLLSRRRLLHQLDQMTERKLGLVSAPPGYGKTTLLADWAGRAPCPAAWLSLDDGDNDASRLLVGLAEAWCNVDPLVRQGPFGLLAESLAPPADRLLAALLQQGQALPEHLVLVLDDYHLVAEPSLYETLAALLEHLPPRLHLLLATQTDPPLPLARLRARGQLLELRVDDLRFTADESRQFLAQLAGVDLPTDAAARLQLQTEGWPAALHLAALATRAADGRAGVPELTGQDRYVADYLAHEVLARQPEDVRSFLVQTAILDQLSGPLCSAVVGCDGQAMLERLERHNLFIQPLDRARRWYRYHPLFADFLRRELEKTFPHGVPRLHQQAAAWYAEEGMPDPAFRHAMLAGDLERAAEVVERHFIPELAHGRYAAPAAWLQALPGELLASRPLLGIYSAFFLVEAGQLDACASRLDELERQLPTRVPEDVERRAHAGRLAVVRTVLACHQNDLEQAEAFAAQALHALPPDDLSSTASPPALPWAIPCAGTAAGQRRASRIWKRFERPDTVPYPSPSSIRSVPSATST